MANADDIINNLWKGGQSFSKFFPAMGTMLGVGLMYKTIKHFNPKKVRKK